MTAINRHHLLIICLLLLALSACRRANSVAPTAQPTLTPTPRSTPLPPVPTAVPAGEEANPLRVAFVARETVRSQQIMNNAAADLEAELSAETGLTVQVDVLDSDAEAIAALCDSVEGTLTVAWLSGLAYSAAQAQGCGEAVLQVERDSGALEEVLIIASRQSEIESLGDLAGKTFCRVRVTDAASWLVPSLMLRAEGVSTADLGAVVDYEDTRALVNAVAEGDCDAAGLTRSDYEQVSNNSTRRAVTELEPSLEIPVAVLTYPPDLPLGASTALTDALIALGNGTRARLLEPLLDQDAIVAADEDTFDDLRAFLDRAGVDLALLGSS